MSFIAPFFFFFFCVLHGSCTKYERSKSIIQDGSDPKKDQQCSVARGISVDKRQKDLLGWQIGKKLIWQLLLMPFFSRSLSPPSHSTRHIISTPQILFCKQILMVVTNNVESSDVLDTTAQSRKLNASFFVSETYLTCHKIDAGTCTFWLILCSSKWTQFLKGWGLYKLYFSWL